MLDNKNVLVAGGGGFIGSNLVRRLLREDCKVYATYHNKISYYIEDVEFINTDLTSEESCLNATKGIDYVFMCAANSSGAKIMAEKPLVHVTPNVIMNSRMLEASHKNNVKKFVFLSSTTVYPVKDVPLKEDDLDLSGIFDKYFCVAWMKVFSEIMCEMYATKIRNPMTTIIARVGNTYGPRDDFEWETSHVIPALIRRVVERHDPIVVWGDGKDLKDLIYIGDLVDGLVLAMDKIDSFEKINLATGQSHTIKEVLDYIIDATGYHSARIEFDPSKPTMIPKRMIDISKAQRLLGFKPSVSMKEGLKRI